MVKCFSWIPGFQIHSFVILGKPGLALKRCVTGGLRVRFLIRFIRVIRG